MSLSGAHEWDPDRRPWTPHCGDPGCDGTCLDPECIPPLTEPRPRPWGAWVLAVLVLATLGSFAAAGAAWWVLAPLVVAQVAAVRYGVLVWRLRDLRPRYALTLRRPTSAGGKPLPTRRQIKPAPSKPQPARPSVPTGLSSGAQSTEALNRALRDLLGGPAWTAKTEGLSVTLTCALCGKDFAVVDHRLTIVRPESPALAFQEHCRTHRGVEYVLR